jgi:hypothetical protein
VKRLLPLVLVLAACSSPDSPDPAPPPMSPPPTWIGLQPGDARNLTGDAGQLTLIYVDETYFIAGVNASALTYEHDDQYVTDYFTEDDGELWWYGRKGSWRAGRGGGDPRPVPFVDDTVTFGDITITLSDDGPSEVETPDGVFEAD